MMQASPIPPASERWPFGNPYIALAGVRCLPIGDSITVGQDSSDGGGWRRILFDLAASDGLEIDFTGSQLSGPSGHVVDGRTWSRENEGYGTLPIDTFDLTHPGLRDVKTAPAIAGFRHDVIILMGGLNDLILGRTQADAIARHNTWIYDAASLAPYSYIVVSNQNPMGSGLPASSTLAAGILANAAAASDAGLHVIPCDPHSAFLARPNWETELINQVNHVHPNDAGYSVMASTLYAAIKRLLFPWAVPLS
jgi:hypothetical protein